MSASVTAADAAPGSDHSFVGHPRGLAYLAFAEAWERFSYYGMQTLLVLYMVGQLLHPGHVEHIAGFIPFRAAIERAYGGPLSNGRARLGDFRALHRARLSDADRRRRHRRPMARKNPDDHDRRAVDGSRSFSDGLRRLVLDRASMPADRGRLFQGQHRQPGWRTLRAERSAARRRVPDLFSVHQRRGHRRTAGRRNAWRTVWLALWFRRRGRRHADLARDLPVRAEVAAGGTRNQPRPIGRAAAPEPRRAQRRHRADTATAGARDGGGQQPADLQCLSALGAEQHRPRVLRSHDADDMADYRRRVRFGQRL